VAVIAVFTAPKSNLQSVRSRSFRAHVQSIGSKSILSSRLGKKYDILQRFEGKAAFSLLMLVIYRHEEASAQTIMGLREPSENREIPFNELVHSSTLNSNKIVA